jgi:hypothetical protein
MMPKPRIHLSPRSKMREPDMVFSVDGTAEAKLTFRNIGGRSSGGMRIPEPESDEVERPRFTVVCVFEPECIRKTGEDTADHDVVDSLLALPVRGG